jgi:hypothetical protein
MALNIKARTIRNHPEPGTQYVYQSEKRRLDKKGAPIDKEEGYMFIPENPGDGGPHQLSL